MKLNRYEKCTKRLPEQKIPDRIRNQFKNQSYEIMSKSLAKPGKKKNGDHVKVLDSEEYLFAVVADGITSQPCDWYASQYCCERLCELIKTQFGQSVDPESLIKTCLEEVNEQLLFVSGKCEGLGSTVCGILWPKEQDEFFYFWLGDSKVYIYQSSDLQQLSIDDTEEVVSTKGVNRSGSISVRNYITNSMGRRDHQIRVKKSQFDAGDSIILASDGFVESSYSFKNKMTKAINSIDLEKVIEKMFEENRSDQADDSTVMVIRRKTEPTEQEIQEYGKDELDVALAPTYKEIVLAYNGLKLGIESKNADLCLRMIGLIKKRGLKLKKEE